MSPVLPTPAKAAGAAYARMFHQVFGLSVVVVRIFMVYGPGQSIGKVIPYIIRSLLEGTAPRISRGDQLITGCTWTTPSPA